MLGFDYNGLKNTIFGGGLGYAHTHVVDNNHLGSASINYYFASLYTTWSFWNFYIEPALFGAYNPIHNKRNIFYSGYNYIAKAHIKDWQLDCHLGFGYNAIFSWGGLEPFISADWVGNWEGSFTEKGASTFSMSQKSHTSSLVQSEAGLRFYQMIKYTYGQIGFKEALSYINRVPIETGKVNSTILGATSPFILSSLTTIQNLGSVSGEVFTQFGKKQNIFLSFNYQGEFGANYISNELFLKLAKNF